MKGVQLVPLSDRVKSYDGDICVRQLKGVEFADGDMIELMKLRKELAGRPYEQSIIELIKSAEDLSSLFCSKLVAEAYQRLALLDDKKPSNEYSPADFSEDKELKLLKGFLDKELIIIKDKN